MVICDGGSTLNAILIAFVHIAFVRGFRADDTGNPVMAGDVRRHIAVMYLHHGRAGGAGIAGADDTAHGIAGGHHFAQERAVQGVTGAHGLAFLSGQAAHAVLAVNRGIAHRVLNRSVEIARKGANIALLLIIADNDTLFNGAVADVNSICAGCHAANKAGLQSLGAGLQGNIFNVNGAVLCGGRTDIFPVLTVVHDVALHQAVAVDVVALDVQILHRGITHIVQQALAVVSNAQRMIPPVNSAAEGLQAGAPVILISIGLQIANGRPGGVQLNVVGKSQRLAREVERRAVLSLLESVFTMTFRVLIFDR